MSAQTPEKRNRSAATVRKAQEPSSRKWLVPAIIGVVVLLAAIIAIALSGGGDSDSADTEGLEQVRPVEVSGTALPTFPGNEASASDPALGQPIPEVSGQSFDGAPVTIAPTGNPQMLLFVAHWCPHCQAEVPVLSEWMNAGGLPAEVELTTIATGTSADAPNYPPSEWLAEYSWPSPILADSEDQAAANAFGLPSYPYFVLVDGDGNVVARATGELTPEQLDAAMAALTQTSS
ncbi:MAG: TlpA family protein disulfide reductase [Actinobacteria bacterium]|nr:MAG: TlpA family protein disulfide reductase [Actinomycetota bacterium]